MDIENDNVNTNNKSTRIRESKKNDDIINNLDEDARLHIKQLKLCYLEEDEVNKFKEE